MLINSIYIVYSLNSPTATAVSYSDVKKWFFFFYWFLLFVFLVLISELIQLQPECTQNTVFQMMKQKQLCENVFSPVVNNSPNLWKCIANGAQLD